MAASGHAIYYQSLEQESILRLEQNQASSFGSRQHHELRLDTLEGTRVVGEYQMQDFIFFHLGSQQ